MNSSILDSNAQWYLENSKKYFGYIGLSSDEPKVILEFMKSSDCPYPIVPPSQNSFFMMCLYSNDGDLDYQQHILEHFIEESIQQEIDSIYVISGENSCYPNGTKPFFERFHFKVLKNLGQTWIKGQGIDNIYLLERDLREG